MLPGEVTPRDFSLPALLSYRAVAKTSLLKLLAASHRLPDKDFATQGKQATLKTYIEAIDNSLDDMVSCGTIHYREQLEPVAELALLLTQNVRSMQCMVTWGLCAWTGCSLCLA